MFVAITICLYSNQQLTCFTLIFPFFLFYHSEVYQHKKTTEGVWKKKMSENGPQINALFLKPFSLGWKREVVRRVITRDKTPNCDIYYISPSKKRFRSMNEIKSNLTDGLSPECFSFKKGPLGLEPNHETIRDAKARGKGVESSKGGLKSAARSQSPEQQPLPKQTKTETEETASKPEPDVQNKNSAGTNVTEENAENKSVREKSEGKEENQSKSGSNQESEKPESPPRSFRQQSLKRNAVLKKVTSTEETKQSGVNIKNLKKITKRSKRLSKSPNVKRPGLRNKKNISVKLKSVKKKKKPLRSPLSKKTAKSEGAKESESNETDKKARDLKSIVKKNIGKYRELREKQKLGVVKSQVKSPSRKLAASKVSRRDEPISQNERYLKPLEKGWRRELVFRNNCTKRGQMADVYYLHPNGKKLRSCREIAENLTHGLTIDYFTFRKEPIGCGEPSEIIRNARPIKRTE